MFNEFMKTDSDVQQDVMDELKCDPRVTDAYIVATARDGVVTLRGRVPHHFEKYTAEQAAQRVGGVRAVVDEIEVQLLGAYERSDEDIARTALMALEWNYQVPEGVKLTVDQGWVTLSGSAEWEYQRTAAKNVISPLMGVCGVTNDITIRPRVQPADVKTRIEDALKRSAEKEGRRIQVSVEGDEVTLTGSVHSISEIEDAKLAAWNSPGVTSVKYNFNLAA